MVLGVPILRHCRVNGLLFSVVARACWAVKMDDDCTSEGDGDVCYCNGDLCNAASTLKFSSIAALAIVAGSLFFQRFL